MKAKFSGKAKSYDSSSKIQRESANKLVELVATFKQSLTKAADLGSGSSCKAAAVAADRSCKAAAVAADCPPHCEAAAVAADCPPHLGHRPLDVPT